MSHVGGFLTYAYLYFNNPPPILSLDTSVNDLREGNTLEFVS
jgi:hypothetical protein